MFHVELLEIYGNMKKYNIQYVSCETKRQLNTLIITSK